MMYLWGISQQQFDKVQRCCDSATSSCDLSDPCAACLIFLFAFCLSCILFDFANDCFYTSVNRPIYRDTIRRAHPCLILHPATYNIVVYPKAGPALFYPNTLSLTTATSQDVILRQFKNA